MNFSAFVGTLPNILIGIVSIFVITLVIVLCIAALNKLTLPRKKDNDEEIK